MMLSWLIHSLCDEIRESVLWRNAAFDLWRELKEKYYEDDQFQIAQLQEELFGGKVICLSLLITLNCNEFGKNLMILDLYWIVLVVVMFVCVDWRLRKYRQADYVVRFLRGLND